LATANQELIGDYLYFFRSPVQTSHCLIFGHSGWVEKIGHTFTVPQGVTLDIRVWHGLPNTSNPTREILQNKPQGNAAMTELRKATPKAGSLLMEKKERKTFRAGESCFNYIVVKGVGKHWDKKKPDESSYSEIAKLVGQASSAGSPVHFISVRNRRFKDAKRFMLLGDVITAVKAHEPRITTIVMGGCRGIHPTWNP